MSTSSTFREYLLCAGLSDGTIRNYVQVVARAERWCQENGEDLESIDGAGVRLLAEGWAQGQASRKMLRAAMGRYWEHLDRANPPAKAIRVPKRNQGVCRALDEDDARILAKAARAEGGQAGLAVAIGLYAGLRRFEIAGLRWVRVGDKYLSVTGKGDKDRDVPIHPRLAPMLAAAPREGEFVFPGRLAGHIAAATVWDWTRKLADRAGVGSIGCHVLRHTCLAEINDQTQDIRATQEVAGHERPETTALYTRVRGRRLEGAVASISY